ncbi:MAG: TerC family protein, partial [Actinomycetota bacterium]|nr:TerC family protein [Actinomycetota bacterium]
GVPTIGIELSLTVIVGVLLITTLTSLWKARRDRAAAEKVS